MFCPFCGHQNTDSAGQCASCGQLLHAYAGSQPPIYQNRPKIPTHLVPAILATLFCCQPFGIIAIVYAALASSKASSGDYVVAMDCSQNAKRWCWVAFWLGFAPMALYFLFMIIGIATGSLQ